MPNLRQIISLREKYAPKENVNEAFSINEVKKHFEFEELQKAFSSEDFKPLLENFQRIEYFSVTGEKQTPDIIEYFEEQRKECVVLLYIDITDFSKKTDKLSSGEITKRLDNYYKILIPIIYEYGGEIEKIMGDGIICIFGRPFLKSANWQEKYIKAECCARRVINRFRHTINDVKIALHSGQIIYYKTPTDHYEEYTMIGKVLTELYRLESISIPNSINYFKDSEYDKLTAKLPLGIMINSIYWKYNFQRVPLKGIGIKEHRYLTRI